MSSNILSIDIRDETVSAILLSSSLKGNRIESHCHVRLDQAPPDAENHLFWAISQIADKMDMSGATCIFSVAPSELTYRNVSVPFTERKKIAQLLPFELESSLPCAVDELTIDFDIVRKSDYTDIIAAAVKTETIDDIVEILKSFDVTPRYITVGPVAEAMCLVRLGVTRTENFLFLSIDDACATACIVYSGKLYTARTFRLPHTDSPDRIRRIKKELLRIAAAFETIYDFDVQFEQIMLSCICPGSVDDAMASLAAELKETFGSDVQTIDLTRDANLKIISAPGDDDFENRYFNSALGLAGIETGGIKPFNFNRDQYFFQKYWMENKTEFIVSGLLAAFVFVLIMTNAIFQVRTLENQVRKLDKEIISIYQSVLPDDERIVDPLQQLQVRIEEVRQKSIMSRNPGRNIPNIDILNAISRRIPDEIDMLITNMVRNDDQMSISATLQSFNAVDDVKGQLEQIDLFKKITISSADMDNRINRVRFRIRADLADI